MELDRRTGIGLLVAQIALLLGFFSLSYLEEKEQDKEKMFAKIYPIFQDIHIMVFVGFGLLMTFLRRYGHSSVGLTLLIAALAIQYGLICALIASPSRLSTLSLIDADVAAAVVLISMGAVLGKTSVLQLLVLFAIEVPIYYVNLHLCERLQVADVGGSITVHLFGAYFGLAATKVLGSPKSNPLEESSYESDLFSIIGTLFLWAYWPSFNAALATGDGQERAVINTYLALAASCSVTFAVSSLTHPKRKFTMAHIQNATLAGGVAVGATANILLMPWAPVLVGGLAGGLSTCGFAHVQEWLKDKLGVHDTCGINNLHGMPAVFAGIVGIGAAYKASILDFGANLYELYPARRPEDFTPHIVQLQLDGIAVGSGEMRSAAMQAVYQLLALLLTFVLAVTSGAVGGLLVRFGGSKLGSVPPELIMDDSLFWSGDEGNSVENGATTHQQGQVLETV